MPKFSEVYNKDVIHDSSYRVNIPLCTLLDNIARYEKAYNLNLNPDFQRGHVWDTPQQERFMEFMLSGAANASGNNVIRFNMPGFISSHQSGHMEIVDGKQRVTACIRFLCNEIKAYGYYFNEYTDELPWTGVDLIFMVNGLEHRRDVLRWYLQINDTGVVHAPEELQRVRGLLKAMG